MIINNKILNLPPYISTSWNNVQSLHMKSTSLIVTLSNGESVQIDGLANELIDTIFAAHRSYLEQQDYSDQNQMAQNQSNNPFNIFDKPLSPTGMEFLQFGQNAIKGIGTAMQHDEALAHAPDLPSEFLDKIAEISKIVAPDEKSALPQAEPNCNCPHCQIANAINGISKSPTIVQPSHDHHDEHVSPEDLTFNEWIIEQTGVNLYQVTNKLDPKEKYQVFLGEPIGCTCGEKNCVHIPAVLKS